VLNPWFSNPTLATFQSSADAQESVIAGFFMASASSKLDLDKVEIDGTEGTVGGAIYVQIGCELDMKNSVIKNVGNEKSGPVIKGESPKSLRVVGSEFDSNKNTYITSETGNLVVEDSKFKNGSGKAFITVTNAELSVSKGSLFSNNTSIGGGEKGLAINCEGCKNVDIKDSAFEKMETTGKGGAVSLDKTCNSKISSNSFSDIKAELGGAIQSSDSQVSVEGSEFTRIAQNFTYDNLEFEPNLLA